MSGASVYQALGWRILPTLGKRPQPALGPTGPGHELATADPDLVQQWAERFPKTNWAVAPGLSGLVVIDVDDPDALRHAPAWLTLPISACVGTRRGWHLYLRRTAERVRRTVQVEAAGVHGVEVKADGALITLPGSVHESGHVYRWLRRPEFGIAPMPAWLVAPPPVEPATPRPARQLGDTADGTPYGMAALSELLLEVEHAPEGSRNATAFRVAVRVAELIDSGDLAGHCLDWVGELAEAAGLPGSEVRDVLASARRTAVR